MKRMKCFAALALVLLMMLCAAAGMAANETRDGVAVTLAGKAMNDGKLEVTLTAKNTNSATTEDVTLKIDTPKGYALETGYKNSAQVGDLAAGETAKLTAVYRRTNAGLPGTGDDSSLLLWLLVLAGALGGWLMLGRVQRMRLTSFLLAAVLLGGAVCAVPANAQAAVIGGSSALLPNFFTKAQITAFLAGRKQLLTLEDILSDDGTAISGSVGYTPVLDNFEALMIAYYIASMPGRDEPLEDWIQKELGHLTKEQQYAIQWGQKNELMIAPGKDYDPEAAITREGIAVLAYFEMIYYLRYLEEKGVLTEAQLQTAYEKLMDFYGENGEKSETVFKNLGCVDVADITEYHEEYVAWALYYGLLTVDAQGRILPQKQLSQKDAIAIFGQAQDMMEKLLEELGIGA